MGSMIGCEDDGAEDGLSRCASDVGAVEVGLPKERPPCVMLWQSRLKTPEKILLGSSALPMEDLDVVGFIIECGSLPVADVIVLSRSSSWGKMQSD